MDKLEHLSSNVKPFQRKICNHAIVCHPAQHLQVILSPSFKPSADMIRATVVLVSVGVPPEDRYVLFVMVITFRRVFTPSPSRSSAVGVVSSVDTTVFSTGSSSFIFLPSVVLNV